MTTENGDQSFLVCPNFFGGYPIFKVVRKKLAIDPTTEKT
jgi:hypothetical protein